MDVRAQEILDFWFGSRSSGEFGKIQEKWFSSGSSDEFDAECAEQCLAEHERAKSGELDHWAEEPQSCLALLVLFDQIPRNVYRGDARSFATDDRARELARKILDRGWDREMNDVERLFAYLPFEHSENLEDQRHCVALYNTMPDTQEKKQDWIDYAVQHLEIIERFGRFPHRNRILGRESTAEEVAFLEETGVHFGTDGHEPKG